MNSSKINELEVLLALVVESAAWCWPFFNLENYFQDFKIPSTPKLPSDQTLSDARSSLGLLPPETLASVTITGNETFSAEAAFGLSFKTPKVPQQLLRRDAVVSPPSPDVAEEQAVSEFNRLRFTDNLRPECPGDPPHSVLKQSKLAFFRQFPTLPNFGGLAYKNFIYEVSLFSFYLCKLYIIITRCRSLGQPITTTEEYYFFRMRSAFT